MRYRVMRVPGGFEVHFGDERAEIIRDHTIISYEPSGFAALVAGMGSQRKVYLEISEDTTTAALLTALENEVE